MSMMDNMVEMVVPILDPSSMTSVIVSADPGHINFAYMRPLDDFPTLDVRIRSPADISLATFLPSAISRFLPKEASDTLPNLERHLILAGIWGQPITLTHPDYDWVTKLTLIAWSSGALHDFLLTLDKNAQAFGNMKTLALEKCEGEGNVKDMLSRLARDRRAGLAGYYRSDGPRKLESLEVRGCDETVMDKTAFGRINQLLKGQAAWDGPECESR